MLSSLAASLAIAAFVAPVDMVLFKKHARTTNCSLQASFLEVWKHTVNRPGGGTALGFAVGSTFIRYFFLLTSLNSYLNFSQQNL